MNLSDLGELVEVPYPPEWEPDEDSPGWRGLNLGGGHYLRPIGRHGMPKEFVGGFIEQHPRPDNGEACEGYISVDPNSSKHWKVESVNPLTLSPSLLCTVCQNHGFVREGKWVPA